MGNNRKKGAKKPPIAPHIQNESEYDVQKNLQRVRQYRQTRSNPTLIQTDSNSQILRNDGISNQSIHQLSPTSDPVRDYYFRLEDKMDDINDKNEVAHTQLRVELENKINAVSNSVSECKNHLDSKLSSEMFKWLYGGIIGVASAIVIIWFTLSYLPLVETTKEHNNNIHSLDKRMDRIENGISLPIDSIKQK